VNGLLWVPVQAKGSNETSPSLRRLHQRTSNGCDTDQQAAEQQVDGKDHRVQVPVPV